MEHGEVLLLAVSTCLFDLLSWKHWQLPLLISTTQVEAAGYSSKESDLKPETVLIFSTTSGDEE